MHVCGPLVPERIPCPPRMGNWPSIFKRDGDSLSPVITRKNRSQTRELNERRGAKKTEGVRQEKTTAHQKTSEWRVFWIDGVFFHSLGHVIPEPDRADTEGDGTDKPHDVHGAPFLRLCRGFDFVFCSLCGFQNPKRSVRFFLQKVKNAGHGENGVRHFL